jgi:antitoxin component YwqK of YwqJK toxin-antitoxin module
MSQTGREIEVRDDQGRLTGRFALAEGRLHGLCTLYGAGRMIAEISYAHGQRDGEMRSYGENGELSSSVLHQADVPHGEARYFHADGSLARVANYSEGRLHGEVRDYAPDGKLLSLTEYVHGKAQAAGQAAVAAPAAVAVAGKSWLARLVEG